MRSEKLLARMKHESWEDTKSLSPLSVTERQAGVDCGLDMGRGGAQGR